MFEDKRLTDEAVAAAEKAMQHDADDLPSYEKKATAETKENVL